MIAKARQHIDKRTMIAYAFGIATAGSGLQILHAYDPTGIAGRLQDSMCSQAIAAQIEYHAAQIMECVADKSLCEGKLEVLSGK